MRQLIHSLRLRQWAKNFLIFLPAVGAGRALEIVTLKTLSIGFLAFSLIASGIYLVNDVSDAELDKAHPRKMNRPVASGELSKARAISAAVGCVLTGIGACIFLLPAEATYIALTYVVYSIIYSLWTKKVPILELISISLGFLLRILFGGSIIETPPSLLLVASVFWGSLAIAGAKRISEHKLNDYHKHQNINNTRPVLRHYSVVFLNNLIVISFSIAFMTFLLWSLQNESRLGTVGFVLQLVVLSFLFLRILQFGGDGGLDQPEDLLRDKTILLGCLIWITTTAAFDVFK